MKFGKSLQYTLSLVTCLLVITACRSGGDKGLGLATSAEHKAKVVDTTIYLPKKSVDEETGLELQYQPRPNPYLQTKEQLPPEVVQWFIQAKRNIKQGNTEIARDFLSKIEAKMPELSGPAFLQGEMAAKEKQWEKAVTFYVKALTINENNVNAYLGLAIAQRELGRFVHAQNTYAKALSKWRDYPEAHFNLAVIYDVYLNQPEKAQKHLEAFEFLAQKKPGELSVWLTDLTERTGLANYIEQDFKIKQEKVLAKIAKDQPKKSDQSSNGGGQSL